MSTKRASPVGLGVGGSSIFAGGGSRQGSVTNGHQAIWSNRPVQDAPSARVSIGPADQARVPSTPPSDLPNREGGGGMRVGKDYQARIPPRISDKEKTSHLDPERALLVWAPTDKVRDTDINHYLRVAKDKFSYSGEQALGLLYWHSYDIPKAIEDLGNFTPHPEEWTIEDKILFEQAFQMHGKAFDRIRQMLPDKSVSNLIRHYYKWKRTRNKTSMMDRARNRHMNNISHEDSEESLSGASPASNATTSQSSSSNNVNSSNYSLSLISQRQPAAQLSDSDDDIIRRNGESNGNGKFCGNCGVPCDLLSKDKMCNTCYIFWKKTGNYRPLTGPLRRGDRQLHGVFRQKRAPPLGMYINHDDLSILASAPPQAENVVIQGLEKDVLDSKCSVQAMKQKIEILKRKIPSSQKINELKPGKADWMPLNPRVSGRWTHEELMLAAQGIRRYGMDFSKIVQMIPSKAETHIKTFYVSYQRRFGLDELVKEHELDLLHEDLIDDTTSIPSNI